MRQAYQNSNQPKPFEYITNKVGITVCAALTHIKLALQMWIHHIYLLVVRLSIQDEFYIFVMARLGFLLVQCGILLFGELAFHSLTLPFWLRMCVYMGALAHAHYSFAVFVSFIVVFWKKLCIRPLKTAHELTTVAIWKTIFVRQLTIFMADFFFFTRFIRKIHSARSLAFVG